MSKILYDAKCYELAKHFLSDVNVDPPGGRYPMSLAEEEQYTADLAAHIQEAVEAWYSVAPDIKPVARQHGAEHD